MKKLVKELKKTKAERHQSFIEDNTARVEMLTDKIDSIYKELDKYNHAQVMAEIKRGK